MKTSGNSSTLVYTSLPYKRLIFDFGLTSHQDKTYPCVWSKDIFTSQTCVLFLTNKYVQPRRSVVSLNLIAGSRNTCIAHGGKDWQFGRSIILGLLTD